MFKKLATLILSALLLICCAFGAACNTTDGVIGIDSVTINSFGELVITTTDGNVKNLGNIKGDDGDSGRDGISVIDAYVNDVGSLIVVLSNGTQINCGDVNNPTVSGTRGLYYTEVLENDAVVGYKVRDYGNASSVKVTIPASYLGLPVVGICENAFFNCKYITEAHIPESVQEIEDNAFWGCSSLKEVTIGSGVTSIGVGAFAYCSALESLHIPSNVKTIGESAFASCISISDITIEEGLEEIGISAFTGCDSLEVFEMPDSVTKMGFGVFMQNMAVKRVKLSDNLTEVPQYTFDECALLEDVRLGSKIETIGYSAFSMNTNLKTLVLPKSVQTIESYAFYHIGAQIIPDPEEHPENVEYAGLDRLFYEGSQTDWENITIGEYGNDGLRNLCFYSESRPTESGSFWRYVDGVPTVWE